eukprot:g15055.t1
MAGRAAARCLSVATEVLWHRYHFRPRGNQKPFRHKNESKKWNQNLSSKEVNAVSRKSLGWNQIEAIWRWRQAGNNVKQSVFYFHGSILCSQKKC